MISMLPLALVVVVAVVVVLVVVSLALIHLFFGIWNLSRFELRFPNPISSCRSGATSVGARVLVEEGVMVAGSKGLDRRVPQRCKNDDTRDDIRVERVPRAR